MREIYRNWTQGLLQWKLREKVKKITLQWKGIWNTAASYYGGQVIIESESVEYISLAVTKKV